MTEPVLDMGNAQHRETLSAALVASGIDTVYSSPAVGVHILEAVLLPDNGRQALSVLAVSLDSSCRIGLSGYRSVGNAIVECGSVELVRVEAISLTVDVVDAFLRGRDLFVADFHAGRYDL